LPLCVVFNHVVVSAQRSRLWSLVGPPWAWLMVWSRSQSAAGMRHPGKIQVGERASTRRRSAALRLLRAVPFQSMSLLSGWVMVTRYCESG
jgi:hypothetical protein